jgi:hypothetical protein
MYRTETKRQEASMAIVEREGISKNKQYLMRQVSPQRREK